MVCLQTKFQSHEITIKATDGEISDDDYINKIKEALIQWGIDLDKKDSWNYLEIKFFTTIFFR